MVNTIYQNFFFLGAKNVKEIAILVARFMVAQCCSGGGEEAARSGMDSLPLGLVHKISEAVEEGLSSKAVFSPHAHLPRRVQRVARVVCASCSVSFGGHSLRSSHPQPRGGRGLQATWGVPGSNSVTAPFD